MAVGGVEDSSDGGGDLEDEFGHGKMIERPQLKWFQARGLIALEKSDMEMRPTFTCSERER